MKTKICFAMIFTTLLLFSCGTRSEKEIEATSNQCTKYACPMHPDKTSTAPAQCPECGMEMVKVVKEKADSTKKSTDGKK